MDAKTSIEQLPAQASDAVPDILIDTFAEANTAVVIFGASGTALYMNGEMEKLGAALEQPISQLTDLAPKERTSAGFVQFERFRAGRLVTLRARQIMTRKDGTDLCADISVRRLAGAAVATPLIVVQIHDVTAEHEAERNAKLWEATLGAAQQGVWDHDAIRGTVTYSKTWRRMRGMDEDEKVDGRRELWLDRLHPDDRDRIEATVDKQETGEDGYDILEYRERHRDGHYISILSRGKPIEWDEDGNSLRTIGTDTDITRLKAIEAELALEKERLHVTLQSIADGVISTDADGQIIFINTAAEHMTGWSAGKALGQRIETVFDTRLENDPDRSADLIAECLAHGRVCRASGYTRLRSKNGRSRYIREIASPVLSETGEVTGAVMVFRDSSKRRKLVKELEYTATHDALTGLDNRGVFDRRLKESAESAETDGLQHALCLIDLDHFKSVNDGAGHSAGDALLKEIATLIRSACRKQDCVARLGGDEFAVILNDCTLKTARNTAQKIIKRIGALKFTWQGEQFTSSASVGITSIDGKVRSTTELYRNADNACYAAKRNGRGCMVVYG